MSVKKSESKAHTSPQIRVQHLVSYLDAFGTLLVHIAAAARRTVRIGPRDECVHGNPLNTVDRMRVNEHLLGYVIAVQVVNVKGSVWTSDGHLWLPECVVLLGQWRTSSNDEWHLSLQVTAHSDHCYFQLGCGVV